MTLFWITLQQHSQQNYWNDTTKCSVLPHGLFLLATFWIVTELIKASYRWHWVQVNLRSSTNLRHNASYYVVTPRVHTDHQVIGLRKRSLRQPSLRRTTKGLRTDEENFVVRIHTQHCQLTVCRYVRRRSFSTQAVVVSDVKSETLTAASWMQEISCQPARQQQVVLHNIMKLCG